MNGCSCVIIIMAVANFVKGNGMKGREEERKGRGGGRGEGGMKEGYQSMTIGDMSVM